MGVQVDEAGGDDEPRDVTHLRSVRGEVRRDSRHLARSKSHIHDAIEPLRGIDDVSAPDNQIHQAIMRGLELAAKHRACLRSLGTAQQCGDQ